MIDLNDLRDELRARPVDGTVNLAGYDPASTPFADSKSSAKKQLSGKFHDKLHEQHELLFAESKRSVVLVLQGLDASGKTGTIKNVMTAVNPVGLTVSSFKEPTEEEEDHNFLWRFRSELPEPGQLGVFDRSYYEDVIVPAARGTEDQATIDERIGIINDFETELVDAGTTIIKCLLHISYDEQRERFLRRLARDDKRWKFSEADLETRQRWNSFQAAYSTTVAQTTPDHAPWYVIPADHKWYRNWIIAQIVIGSLDAMAPAYPQPDLDIEDLRSRLQPPN